MYVSKADAAKAREMDLLTYMENYEPDNLFRVCAGNYRLVEHDSVVISNGLWCQKSTGIGGRTALDYLVKVRQIPFPDAVAQIIGKSSVQRPIFRKQPVKRSESLLSLGGIAAYSTPALPIALEEYLKHNPQTKAAVLYLDNDEKGRITTQKIQENILYQDSRVELSKFRF